eukprot:s146_g13.t3
MARGELLSNAFDKVLLSLSLVVLEGKMSPKVTNDVLAAALPGNEPPEPRRPAANVTRVDVPESLPPWRQPQKPYAPSMMAGQGFASLEAKTVLVFRPRGGEFCTTGRSTLDGPWIKDRFITQRKPEWRTEAWRCPTSREEMQPQVCAKQVLDWWPYLSPRPALKVRLKRRPIDR